MHLFLIGPLGSGKSSVARQAARWLDRPLIAVDDEVQRTAGQTIAEIFQMRGEADFRDLEAKTLAQAVCSPAAVLDLGGGAILSESNRHLIRQTGKAVWLFADPAILWERVNSDPRSVMTRPPLLRSSGQLRREITNLTCEANDALIAGPEPEGLAELRQVVLQREAIYAACADYEIDTGALSVEEIARRVVAWFSSVDKRSIR